MDKFISSRKFYHLFSVSYLNSHLHHCEPVFNLDIEGGVVQYKGYFHSKVIIDIFRLEARLESSSTYHNADSNALGSG